MRINDGLVEILREFKEKASTIGIRQFIIQTHFQTPLEVTPEAAEGIRKLLAAGWLIDNQLVYNVAASRRGHTTRLRQVLNQLGVVCYYTFSVKGFEENNAVFTPNSRSVQEQREEKRFGKLTKEDAHNLSVLLGTVHDPAACIRRFLKHAPPAFPRHRPQCTQSARHRQEHDLQHGRHHPRRQAHPTVRP